MIADILQDAFFAAIAAIGFASISNPPRNTYLYCAIIAAIGHSLRFVLMQSMLGLHIVAATGIAAFAVGLAAVLVSPRVKEGNARHKIEHARGYGYFRSRANGEQTAGCAKN